MASSNITQLANVASDSVSASWDFSFGPNTSVLDASNVNFQRRIQLSSQGVLMARGNITAAIPLAQVMRVIAIAVPTLTWPPIIGTQPASHSAVAPAATTFTVVATSEIPITYQWQIFTASVWTNLTNAGVYTTVTTATLNISNSTGLNGALYRCVVTNGAGSTNTSQATLTVT